MTTNELSTADFLAGLRHSISVGRMAITQAASEGMDRDAATSLELFFAALEDAVGDRAKLEMRRFQA